MCRVCLSSLWSPVCVVQGLLRVLLVCGNMLCIVVHLALRPSDIWRPSCYKSLWTQRDLDTLQALLLYMCIVYSESLVVLLQSASIA